MAAACQTVPQLDRFGSGMLGFIDCEARNLGADGYQALAAPGSSISLLIAASLTILVAIVGYRMLFGETPRARDGILLMIRIGVVLALTTSWPTFQTIIYDVVMDTPAQLASEIGGASGLMDESGLAGRIDRADQAFRSLAVYGPGQPQTVSEGEIVRREPGLFNGSDTFSLGAARAVFLAGAIGAFALVRLGSGLLLALGPLFIAFLLFAGTRGWFEGWLRGLGGLMLAGIATAIVSAIELALLEPWLQTLLAARESGQDIYGVPLQLLAMTLVFAALLIGVITLTMRVAAGLRLNTDIHVEVSSNPSVVHAKSREHADGSVGLPPQEARSRAAGIADALVIGQRREEAANAILPAIFTASSIRQQQARAGDNDMLIGSRVGNMTTRRVQSRISAGAMKRDRR